MSQSFRQIRQSTRKRAISRISRILTLGACLIAPMMLAQITTGSLSGTARDTTGAAIPKADVTLLNDATNDIRKTVTDGTGYFTFAAVQPGTYSVTVESPGFSKWTQTGIVMNSGDTRQVADIQLGVGAASAAVTVSANAAQILPTDSGERSMVITSKDLEQLSLEGRNVSELLKVLPGVTTVANGTSGGS